jgi:hypothetical protein
MATKQVVVWKLPFCIGPSPKEFRRAAKGITMHKSGPPRSDDRETRLENVP